MKLITSIVPNLGLSYSQQSLYCDLQMCFTTLPKLWPLGSSSKCRGTENCASWRSDAAHDFIIGAAWIFSTSQTPSANAKNDLNPGYGRRQLGKLPRGKSSLTMTKRSLVPHTARQARKERVENKLCARCVFV